jgi:hypothetical protein
MQVKHSHFIADLYVPLSQRLMQDWRYSTCFSDAILLLCYHASNWGFPNRLCNYHHPPKKILPTQIDPPPIIQQHNLWPIFCYLSHTLQNFAPNSKQQSSQDNKWNIIGPRRCWCWCSKPGYMLQRFGS